MQKQRTTGQDGEWAIALISRPNFSLQSLAPISRPNLSLQSLAPISWATPANGITDY
ncbi:hypothetical protein HPC62_20485 [Thermoleptolyngbya sichuanensis A183]|uniref:Uncharacterized protein n=1 Tax=Thermoleptolyngbya sichuanensis A183 TaxID=2737172 RepID=A0A6M8BC66_9CYAN|nr:MULTISPECIES: hypothetical protein [Thermoleptolyngbya]QKD84238.1 hypothetical protein HPC62_20485 [Thermoleptolyngbya sichuanensis A183]